MRIMRFLYVVVFLITVVQAEENVTQYLYLPPNVKLGVSTSAHQIEGAWNVSDKTENVWDKFVHDNPGRVIDRSNADVACDSYNNYKKDLLLLKELGVDFYRMSISWARILPNGFANRVSAVGIQYYKNVFDDLNALGIEPLVTIYHFDHPVVLEKMGGWTNEMMVTWFADYARVIFQEFGDRVKTFATLNEPGLYCQGSYGKGLLAPGKSIPGIGPYLCMHNMLKAHAKAYSIYDNEFRNTYGGQIGIVASSFQNYPKDVTDTEAAEVQFAFECGWLTDPIFSKTGDYPYVMKQRIYENSRLEGYPRSRLPEFTPYELENIRGSSDFLGLNHYSSQLVTQAPKTNSTLWWQDSGNVISHDPKWPGTITSWLKIVPEGFGDLLRKLKDRYNNPPVYIMENGCSDDGSSLEDHTRIEYFHGYLKELMLAINRDGCKVERYAAWSLMDSFEWVAGYRERFGMVHVDFNDSARTRTPKLSYTWYQNLIRKRTLPGIF